MKNISFVFLSIFAFCLLALSGLTDAHAHSKGQQPTVPIPTVTGTPSGVIASVSLDVEDSPKVRSGPGVFYDQIGVLLPGQKVPVIGRTPGGDWLKIEYPGTAGGVGWIYAPLVSLTPGELSIVEPPPAPTVMMTQTINPTLAAQFITTPIPTRLPTFTPANPLVVPTMQDFSISTSSGGIPMGLVITILIAMGITLGVAALFQRH